MKSCCGGDFKDGGGDEEDFCIVGGADVGDDGGDVGFVFLDGDL